MRKLLFRLRACVGIVWLLPLIPLGWAAVISLWLTNALADLSHAFVYWHRPQLRPLSDFY
jgi:hypothetical protein